MVIRNSKFITEANNIEGLYFNSPPPPPIHKLQHLSQNAWPRKSFWFLVSCYSSCSCTCGLSSRVQLLASQQKCAICLILQRCPNIKTILGKHANTSRLLPVGWIDVQLMMYLLPVQIKLELVLIE